jgi:hypothetical protein
MPRRAVQYYVLPSPNFLYGRYSQLRKKFTIAPTLFFAYYSPVLDEGKIPI